MTIKVKLKFFLLSSALYPLLCFSSDAQTLKIKNLPMTCLPSYGRISTNRNDSCHCPPIEFCTEKVSYHGKEFSKLPDFIQSYCCPVPTPTPPPPPLISTSTVPLSTVSSGGTPITSLTGTTNNNQCDVHYLKSALSDCEVRTRIGPRTANYCSVYTTTDTSHTAAVNSLNTCLENSCKPIHTRILQLGGSFDRGEPSGFSRELQEIPAQMQFKNYVNCRTNCFNNSGLSSLVTISETSLNRWVNRDLNNAYTDDYLNRPGGKSISSHKSYTSGDLNAKIFNAHPFGTINQSVFGEYVNNTIPAHLSGLNFGAVLSVNKPDENLNNTSYPDRTRTDHVNFFNFTNQNGFLPVSRIVDTTSPSFSYLSPIPTINCSYFERINTCITTYGNDGNCLSCLSPDTEVTMHNNKKTAIKMLKIGDIVQTSYGKKAKITDVIEKKWPSLILYDINHGQIKLTADHPIMTRTGWKAVDFDSLNNDDVKAYKKYGVNNVGILKKGDEILTESGFIEIQSIKALKATQQGTTFNLQLETPHKSFYANGVLVKSQQ